MRTYMYSVRILKCRIFRSVYLSCTGEKFNADKDGNPRQKKKKKNEEMVNAHTSGLYVKRSIVF